MSEMSSPSCHRFLDELISRARKNSRRKEGKSENGKLIAGLFFGFEKNTLITF